MQGLARKPEFAVVVVLDDVPSADRPAYKPRPLGGGNYRARRVLVRRRDVQNVRLAFFDVGGADVRVHAHILRAVQSVRRGDFSVTGVFHRIEFVSAQKFYYYAVEVFRTRADNDMARVDVYPPRAVEIRRNRPLQLDVAAARHAF